MIPPVRSTRLVTAYRRYLSDGNAPRYAAAVNRYYWNSSLLAILVRGDTEMRRAAALALGMLGDHAAIEPLGRALAFWERIDGSAAQETERLGLSSLLDVPVRYLSTGQRKRAALARLLGQRAETWLLDEPLNGLDRDGTALVEALVAEHRAAGGTVVAASHQPIALPGAQTLDLRDHPA